MKRFTILAVMAALTTFGFARQAQAVPSIIGIQAFSVQAQYLSLAGYLRWQTFMESNMWISRAEAEEVVRSQVRATK